MNTFQEQQFIVHMSFYYCTQRGGYAPGAVWEGDMG